MSKVTVELSPLQTEDVARLAEKYQTTPQQLARRALALYSYVHDEAKNGAELVVQQPDGSEIEIVGL